MICICREWRDQDLKERKAKAELIIDIEVDKMDMVILKSELKAYKKANIMYWIPPCLCDDDMEID